MGQPSGVPGRKPAHVSTTATSTSRGAISSAMSSTVRRPPAASARDERTGADGGTQVRLRLQELLRRERLHRERVATLPGDARGERPFVLVREGDVEGAEGGELDGEARFRLELLGQAEVAIA